jgi:hypothetical protein
MESQEELKECMLREMDMTQDIIRRMASNSFLLKGWAVTLVVGIMLLQGPHKYQVSLALVPLVAFWYLDAYFLRQERLYRKLYAWVIGHRLTTEEHLFDMDATRFGGEVDSPVRTMFCGPLVIVDEKHSRKTGTLLCFYGPMAIVVIAYLLCSIFCVF